MLCISAVDPGVFNPGPEPTPEKNCTKIKSQDANLDPFLELLIEQSDRRK